MRTNMVGTNWAWVTLCSCMSARQRSGSKCSMTTTVPPRRWAVMDHTKGAEWYRGAGLRYTSPGPNPMIPPSMPESVTSEPKGRPLSGRRIPLGCPVVPEEYSIGEPSTSSASGSAGDPATNSS